MSEKNLMKYYPRSKKPLSVRLNITEEDRFIARQFDKDYFDGDRRHGYGGYYYHPRFWTDTVKYIKNYYNLSDNASILDIGCGKGFFLHDFEIALPETLLIGIDISRYACEHAIEDIRPFLIQGNTTNLPFPDKSFDLVTAINTIHNLPFEDCKKAISEIQRVSKKHAFIVVDAWRNDEEQKQHEKWVLTCETAMHVDDWSNLFDAIGYSGDYFWTFTD